MGEVDDKEQERRDKAFLEALAKDARESNAAKIAAGAIHPISKGSWLQGLVGSKYKGRWRLR